MLALLCFPAYLICSLFLVAAAPMRKIQGLAPLNVIETANLQRVTGMRKVVLCDPPRVVGRDVDVQRSHLDVISAAATDHGDMGAGAPNFSPGKLPHWGGRETA